MKGAKTVDEYIESRPAWTKALQRLRRVLNATELEETVKWGAPCYTLDGKNVVGLAAFSSYVGLWFHQGVFLTDPLKVLINAQGTTKALRQWRFEEEAAIDTKQVKAYVEEAVANQRAGKVVKADRAKSVVVPAELAAALSKNAALRKAYAALTKGKQREYADHIAGAKKEETRRSRVEKALPLIKQGRGLHDKYRNC